MHGETSELLGLIREPWSRISKASKRHQEGGKADGITIIPTSDGKGFQENVTELAKEREESGGFIKK